RCGRRRRALLLFRHPLRYRARHLLVELFVLDRRRRALLLFRHPLRYRARHLLVELFVLDRRSLLPPLGDDLPRPLRGHLADVFRGVAEVDELLAHATSDHRRNARRALCWSRLGCRRRRGRRLSRRRRSRGGPSRRGRCKRLAKLAAQRLHDLRCGAGRRLVFFGRFRWRRLFLGLGRRNDRAERRARQPHRAARGTAEDRALQDVLEELAGRNALARRCPDQEILYGGLTGFGETLRADRIPHAPHERRDAVPLDDTERTLRAELLELGYYDGGRRAHRDIGPRQLAPPLALHPLRRILRRKGGDVRGPERCREEEDHVGDGRDRELDAA